jgi:hypothetical protein
MPQSKHLKDCRKIYIYLTIGGYINVGLFSGWKYKTMRT